MVIKIHKRLLRGDCNIRNCIIILVTTSLPSAAFGEGTGRIWMSDLLCGGSETSLFSCSSSTPLGTVESSTSCSHSNDVAVRCQGLPSGDLIWHNILLQLSACYY